MLYIPNPRNLPQLRHATVLVDPSGLPRFWATVWACSSSGGLAESTFKKRSIAIDRFYSFADGLVSDDGLDDALAVFDFLAIQSKSIPLVLNIQ
jgi:hypothetical protein